MDAIILAAGYSSRANAFKMTMPIGHMTVLEQTMSKFEGTCSRVIVVTGFKGELIQKEVERISKKEEYSFKIKCVYNESFKSGMFTSVQKGCNEVTTEAFFVTPGDCPLVSKETVGLLAEYEGNVVIPSFHYKGGHPIKLSSEVKTGILENNPESSLRNVLGGYEKEYINVDDPGVIMDIDTPEDYQKAIEFYQL